MRNTICIVQAWISIEKKLIASISSTNNQVASFSYAGVIPPGSKEVLIYVTIEIIPTIPSVKSH